VNFQVGDTSYTVPAGIELLIENNTVGTISFNTCDSLSIRYQGELVMLPESVCEDVVLMSRESKNLNLSKEYELFSEVGSYTFLFKNNGIELAAQTQIEYRGSISKVFVGLFYAPIYNLLAYLIGIFNNSLGLAILAITIILRILLLFPQHKMLVSQRKMQAIQPKIKKLQEKNK
jgi:membrane protein insertase Oxa1/YidC/SpoIIIJ